MADIINIRGVNHDKSQYRKWTLSKFADWFGKQVPYKLMQPLAREKALEEDYNLLCPKKKEIKGKGENDDN